MPELPRLEGNPPLVVEVWGDAALFTRPESKVERQSYPVMTPTAAVGLLESIFWKPEFTWQVCAVEVLAPIQEATVRRNETVRVVAWDRALAGETVDTATHRTQRATTYLRDVRYRIHAHVVLRAHATEPAAKYRDQFRRRVERGACFSQPYFGAREFPASFGPPTDLKPISLTGDLGIMLHSITHGEDGKDPRSHWFTARIDQGVLHVPKDGIATEVTT